MRLIGSVRVSTDEQASSGVSLDAQTAKIRDYCRVHNHDLVEVISDPGESAKSLDRPGIFRALALLDTPEIDGLIVAKLDRLTRSVADFEMLLKRFFGKAGGKQLVSATEHIDTRSASGRLVLRIQVSVSQWELEVNHERTESALAHKQSQGERTGSIPYGFDLDPNGPRNAKGRLTQLVENPHEQNVIGLIKGMALAGCSHRTIAGRLNDAQIPTKTGKAWRHQTIANILERTSRELPDAETVVSP